MKKFLIMAAAGMLMCPSVHGAGAIMMARFAGMAPVLSCSDATGTHGGPAMICYDSAGFLGRMVIQGRCSSVYDTVSQLRVDEVLNAAPTTNNPFPNRYCYCQLVYPFVSNFFPDATVYDYGNALSCAQQCTQACLDSNNLGQLYYVEPATALYTLQ